jgi:hypothetical protein
MNWIRTKMVRRRRVDQVKEGRGENDRCRWEVKRKKEKERREETVVS